jgi:predicted RNase H-like nuclease
MRSTENDDNGSLYTGRERLEVGTLVEIAGEDRVRRVTYVMGSDAKGWRACFKGQGAVPVGTVQWQQVAPGHQGAPLVAAPSPRNVLRASAPSGVLASSTAPTVPPLPYWEPRPRTSSGMEHLVISGFDSAWTASNRGAIASIAVEGTRARFIPPTLASFAEAPEVLEEHRGGAPLHIIPLDQPLVVPNAAGRRPVERAVSGLIGRLGGGVQPANRSRADMFGDAAPLWSFLQRMEASLDPREVPGATHGRLIVEVYPVLALVGLLPFVLERKALPKYNPERPTFRIEDWQLVCDGLGALASAWGIAGVQDCITELGLEPAPRKHHQDKVDAIICALVGYSAWTRPDGTLLVGDLHSGYMVSPAPAALRQSLEHDALLAGVPLHPLRDK